MTQPALRTAQVIPLRRPALRLPPLDFGGARDRNLRRRLLAFLAISAALHLLVALLWPQPRPQVTVEPQALTVRLEEQRIQAPQLKPVPLPRQQTAARPRLQPEQASPEPMATTAPVAEEPPPAPPAVLTAPQGGGAPAVAAAPAEAPRPEPITLPIFDAAYLSNPPPDYPAVARRRGLEGTVRLSVLVSETGLPKEIKLAKSSGTSALDEAALDAVKGWKFVPARQGSHAVAAWVEVPIRFRLEGR